MNIYFYIFTEKVHQYDAQCIMTGDFLFLKGSVYCICNKRNPQQFHSEPSMGFFFIIINQAPLFLSSLAGQSRHQSSFLRLSMLYITLFQFCSNLIIDDAVAFCIWGIQQKNSQSSFPRRMPVLEALPKKLSSVQLQHGSYDCSSNQPTHPSLLGCIPSPGEQL